MSKPLILVTGTAGKTGASESHRVHALGEVVRGAMASEEADPLGVDRSDISTRTSACRVSVFGSGPGC